MAIKGRGEGGGGRGEGTGGVQAFVKIFKVREVLTNGIWGNFLVKTVKLPSPRIRYWESIFLLLSYAMARFLYPRYYQKHQQ